MAKSEQDTGVLVEVLRFHTFNHEEHQPGEQYRVVGDAIQAVDQYLETLQACGLAKPAGAVSAKTIEEFELDQRRAAVAPLTTNELPTKDAPKEPAKDIKAADPDYRKPAPAGKK